ncbi:amidohydrolase family protein [Gemmobacter nectariphilus]|uniref:amidohydrolase family protein n=1 Tax=Gemmobacter nectariphilus TaxID=220343 RepID=UPI001FDF8B0D|nr:amidohydrolase [Gemmobacter nectariphilus]
MLHPAGRMTTLFTNACLLPCTADMPVIDRGWLLVTGEVISALGGGAAPEVPGAEVVDLGGDVLMPGMVNPHSHLAMSLFRGLGEDVDDRLYRYILPLEREFVAPDMVRAGTGLSALELIQGGVTTVADMYYFETVVAEVLDSAGLRGVVGQTLADFDPPDHRDFDEGFARVEELMDRYRDHPRITPGIAPHAPYSTGMAVMERVAAWAEANPGYPVQIHLAETGPETDWAAGLGLSPVQAVAQAGLLRPGLVAAHCLHVSPDDIALMAASGVGVAHNARANGKGGRGIAPVTAMRAAGIPVGISTDGPMSGNTLDLFAQFAPVSMFQKIAGGSRKPMPAVEVIRMATIEGARVLGLHRHIGSLEPGKQADLIRVSMAAPRLHPVYDIYATLVFSAMAPDVADVMVAGRWLMRGRQVLSVDPAKARADAAQVAGRFRGRMAEIDRALRGR